MTGCSCVFNMASPFAVGTGSQHSNECCSCVKLVQISAGKCFSISIKDSMILEAWVVDAAWPDVPTNLTRPMPLRGARKLAPCLGRDVHSGAKVKGGGFLLAACATGGSAACGSRKKRPAGYPSAGHVDDGSNHPAKRRSSYSSRSAYNSPTHSLSMSPVPRKENSPKTVTTPVEIQYWLFMYSSTEQILFVQWCV